ncbi:MAG: NAD+ synthase [Crenarchaeota archaeon]|nr:NAD+ synthase [Thermoproteota archaeon]
MKMGNMVLPRLDYPRVAHYIAARLRQFFEDSGRKVGVVGLSGGVDSSVVAYLTTMALGKDKTRLYLLPSSVTPSEDMEDAVSVIKKLGIPDENWRIINIDEIVKAFERNLGQMSKVERGNIMARTRMTILYHEAAVNNGLVIGSGDKSEYLAGYFTKHGDGGADVLPIAGLYKTHVRQLAEYLKIPERIWIKPPSPALWPGQTAEEELGIDYTTLDTILYLRFDKKLSEEMINRVSGIPLETVERILERVRLTRHKRQLPKRFVIDYEEMRIETF